MGEPESSYEGPPGSWDNQDHQVTLSAFSMSETEVTNAQYVVFLNGADAAGWVDVKEESVGGAGNVDILIYGTSSAPASVRNVAWMDISGTRVMKDHDNEDGDDNSFTGEIEPENPLNLSYIGHNPSGAAGTRFYVLDPRDQDDIDWQEKTDYFNYSSSQNQPDTSEELNDYDSWPELEDYPNNLPTQSDVSTWPATFVRWYGATAFATFYELSLPTEAQWEYAAQGGSGFVYATADGAVAGDGSSAIWNHKHEEPAKGHVLDAKTGTANPYGLYNLAGNVWEWTADYYDSDFYEDTTDPQNQTESETFVRRGGSWNYHQTTLKSASRFYDEAFKGNDHFGFRVVGPAE